MRSSFICFFFFQAEDGIRDLVRSRGLGDVYKRQAKLLVDPAARRIAGELRWSPELVAPGVDSSPLVPLSLIHI